MSNNTLPESTRDRIKKESEVWIASLKVFLGFLATPDWEMYKSSYEQGLTNEALRSMGLVEFAEKVKRMGLEKLDVRQDKFLNMLVLCAEKALSDYEK